MSFSAPRGLASLSLRRILWIAVAAVVFLSLSSILPSPLLAACSPVSPTGFSEAGQLCSLPRLVCGCC